MRLSKKKVMIFQQSVLDWYGKNGRGYIWREYSDPYKILVSEIMLQQTNADKVPPVYQLFTQQYPMDCTPMIRQVGLGESGGVGRYSVE